MKSNDPIAYPPLHHRLYSVWYRHMRVYLQHIISNGFPPFFEPLIFLAGVGLGLGRYIEPINGQPYVQYLAIGLLITSSMWTSFFECTFGTFIRMEFQKVYDGMLAAPITANNLIVGEMLWAGSKGFFFSLAVLCILTLVSLIWPNALPMLPMFPVSNLPKVIQPVAEIVPLTHSVRIIRGICDKQFEMVLWWDVLYIIVFTLVVGWCAVQRLNKRLIR